MPMNLNFSAPINISTGYAVVSINLLKSLIQQNHEVTLWPIGPVEAISSNAQLIENAIKKQKGFDKNAPSIRHYHQFALQDHIGDGPKIGSTVFELDRFSEQEISSLKGQDALCVPTEWAKKILMNNGIEKPICILPHGVDRTIFNENVAPNIKRGNETVFINIGKWEIRKSHDILVDAFNKAFSPKDRVFLIMCCYNPFYSLEDNEAWARLYKDSPLGDHILVISDRLPTQEDVAGLMASADCGVFPSRAEGWGLESFEMMSLGKSIIITNYAGHTGYATYDNSLLIEPEGLEDAYDGKWFFGQGQWMEFGESQIDQLINHMRSVHKMKQQGSLEVNNAGIETAKKLSWNNSAQCLTKFIEVLI
jgi:glycosyltransferase involved in cell wall biosynthesis